MIDGRSLVAMTSAPNALSKDSALFNLHLVSGFDGGSYAENPVVGAASLVYLVESVQNSLTAPLMGLPPFMDPCSSLYRTKEGSDVEVLSPRPPPPAPPDRPCLCSIAWNLKFQKAFSGRIPKCKKGDLNPEHLFCRMGL